MQKYLDIFKFKFQTALAFRSEIVIWVFLDLLPFFLLFIVYGAIFAGHDAIKGVTLSDVVFFYVVVSVLQRITSIHFEGWRCEDIRNGRIDFFFLRPFTYIKDIFITDISGKIFDQLIFIPVFLLFLLITTSHFSFSVPPIHIFQLIQFIFLIVTSYIAQVFIATFIVLLTFWFEASDGLQHFKWVAINLFSGSFVPREFMPNWMLNMTNNLPFKYMYVIPIEVLQGKYALQISDVIHIAIFMLFLLVSVQFVFHKAVFTYSSHGG